MAQPAQGIRFCLIRWDIVKGEGSENHVKPAWRELAASVITNKVVISRRVECARLVQHRLRDVYAGNLQAEISEKSSRPTGSAAEVERSTAVAIAANQSRQVAKGEVVCSRKLKRRICAGALLVFIHVAERAIHSNFSTARRLVPVGTRPERIAICRPPLAGAQETRAAVASLPRFQFVIAPVECPTRV